MYSPKLADPRVTFLELFVNFPHRLVMGFTAAYFREVPESWCMARR